MTISGGILLHGCLVLRREQSGHLTFYSRVNSKASIWGQERVVECDARGPNMTEKEPGGVTVNCPNILNNIPGTCVQTASFKDRVSIRVSGHLSFGMRRRECGRRRLPAITQTAGNIRSTYMTSDAQSPVNGFLITYILSATTFPVQHAFLYGCGRVASRAAL